MLIVGRIKRKSHDDTNLNLLYGMSLTPFSHVCPTIRAKVFFYYRSPIAKTAVVHFHISPYRLVILINSVISAVYIAFPRSCLPFWYRKEW